MSTEVVGNQRNRSPIEENYLRVSGILTSMQVPFRRAIETGDGNEVYHEAEIARLDKMRDRIGVLVAVHRITEPINEVFVQEMIKAVDALDYAHGVWPRTANSDFMLRSVQQAVEASRQAQTEVTPQTAQHLRAVE